ncbi:MAG: T9SS type A sorting domain-containing protein [Lewinellaceae bacterium]|nr:T9SS type A sorting domain-containing protein [Lewinellaceae bacterium]
MTKANSTSFAKFWGGVLAAAFVLMLNVQANAQCTLVCNNLVQVSLDQSCYYALQPDDVLEAPSTCPNGNLVVEMKINGVWVPAILTSSHINLTLQVRVRDLISGNSCSGFAHVEDKLPPVVTCQNITVSCAVSNYEPGYLDNTLGIAAAYPTIDENCGSFTQNYTDTWNDLGCGASFNGQSDLSGYVKRIWTVTDNSGNQSNCTQYIYFKRKHVYDVSFPADVTVDCSNPVTAPSATGSPYILDFGIQFGLYPNNTFCELQTAYTDQVLPICDGTWKILRTWTVYDWCLPTSQFPPNQNPLYFIQVIKVHDVDGPTFACPDNTTVNTNPWSCTSDTDLPDVIITDNCSRIASIVAKYTVDGITTTLNGSLTSFPGNNLWNPDTLGQVGYAQNLPLGVTPVEYIVTDDCGNSTHCTFNVTVEDLSPPAAVCDQNTVVSLGVNGMILVNASTFDDGSYDNCSAVHFKVRRMDANGCDPSNAFDDQVKFCCEDIGDTITVVFRVYDVTVQAGEVSLTYQEDHSNDCMVQVVVQDKIKPVCQSPANVTVSCENFDPSLWAYGFALASDNCCIDTVTTTTNYSQFDTLCNKGTIVRTFRAFDCGGLSSQCTQRIVVNYEQDYYVKFPNDVIVTECNGSGIYGEPTFFGEDCELLGVSHQDEIFTVVPDACYKIERTWTIINWCTYNPNLPCINVPNPNPNAISNHPSNLPGPTVSALGTPTPWNPTVVKINPTDPQATNYSIFWDANANCYKYKQIIKVIDNEAPIFANCPASPVEICDLTANDPLFWNDAAYWDNTIGSHDLCEAPTDLCVTLTDSCSGANVSVRYLLFLDMNGDGVMETQISSTNPPAPNTIPYLGGTPFDNRPVPANQKYRFNIDWTTNGNARTACVRWDNLAQPANLNDNVLQGVVPQLPYGTHKIKWIAQDGCGNESICEYTFVVKDCKKPTVVCINGLSVNIMPTGMIQLWASDFLQYTEDNCTPANQIKIGIQKSVGSTGAFPVDGQGNPITSVTFTCAELGPQAVQLWAIDAAGNADFCETYVIVQDNMGNSTPGNFATVAGAAKMDFNVPTSGLEGANIQILGQAPNGLPPVSFFTNTTNSGTFNFNAIPVSGNYVVTPEKDNDPLNGVTTYDLVLISKHILGLETLGTPYKMIAADANKSNSITTYDIVELRKLILGIYNELPDNTSWRFVKEDYTFADPTNPFASNFPESYDIQSLQTSGMNGADFVAVKTGDVNGTAIANSLVSSEDRSAGTLFFDVDNREVAAGDLVTVNFKAAEKVAGFQFTMNLNGLDLQEIVPADKVSADNFAVFAQDHAITASVDGASQFTMTFRATQAGELSKMLGVSSRITKSEAYQEDGTRYDVAFRFNGQQGAVIAGAGFELLQNMPNPVASSTNINFNLPEASEATLTITNAEGRVVKVVKGEFAKGLNSITLNRADLQAGILFYQLDTKNNSAVKKMIVVE